MKKNWESIIHLAIQKVADSFICNVQTEAQQKAISSRYRVFIGQQAETLIAIVPHE